MTAFGVEEAPLVIATLTFGPVFFKSHRISLIITLAALVITEFANAFHLT